MGVVRKKKCNNCGKWKPCNGLYFYRRQHGYQSRCILCSKAKKREYHKRSGVMPARVAQMRKRKSDLADKLWLLKSSMPCSKCHIYYAPWITQFHHRDPAQKWIEISKMVANGYAWERILDEIKKCDLLCANCHRHEEFRDIERATRLFGNSYG